LQAAVVVDRIGLFVEDDGQPLVLSATYPLTVGGYSMPSGCNLRQNRRGRGT
jgi:hypothetical protein